MRTLYDILGIASTSTPPEVRRAYRRGAMRWHPDRHSNHIDEATRRFNEIGDAYRVLSSPTRRSQYDETLRTTRARLREPVAATRERRDADIENGNTMAALSAYAWRGVHALDREVDAAWLGIRRVRRWLRGRGLGAGRSSQRRVASAFIFIAIIGLVLALPKQQRATARVASTVPEEQRSAVGGGTARRRDVLSDVFPAYDPASRTAPFTLRALPPSPVYDDLRPLEGHAMVARLVMQEDLGTAYRMYYFGIVPASSDDVCASCGEFLARFMTRRHASGETVVVPMQLISMPERATKRAVEP